MLSSSVSVRENKRSTSKSPRESLGAGIREEPLSATLRSLGQKTKRLLDD
jgi:hypothetical protein